MVTEGGFYAMQAMHERTTEIVSGSQVGASYLES